MRMAQRIWKYNLNESNPVLPMPDGARILSVQVQRDDICIWAMIDDEYISTQVERRFRIHGTGHVIENGDALVYLGTVQMSGGSLVLHVFEVSR